MKIKKKMYVIECGYTDDGIRLSEFSEGHREVVLGHVYIEADFYIPSRVEIRDIKVASLKKSIQKERADAQIKIERLEEEIQKLMALGVDNE